jgi:hypothetical protein
MTSLTNCLMKEYRRLVREVIWGADMVKIPAVSPIALKDVQCTDGCERTPNGSIPS